MAKKQRKKRRSHAFVISTSFPPSDPIAVDLFRLQAAYNDLAFAFEWVDAHKRIPSDRHARIVAASRWSFQFRLLAGIMHETLNVLGQMESLPGFPHLEAKMDQDGRRSLERLRKVRSGQDQFSKKFLAITRHKTAYHYDRNEFADALQRLLARYGQTSQSHVLFIEESSGQEEFHFELPDEIRVEIAVGLTGGGGARDELNALLDLVGAFGTFLENILIAYSKDRGLEVDFRLRG